jgi:hypothetical protein
MAKQKPKPSYRETTLDDIPDGILGRYRAPEEAQVEPEKAPRSWARVAGDVGISALKGAISLPEAAVGGLDMLTGGRAGKALEDVGFRPKEAKAFLDEQYSDEQKQAFKNVNDAQGFGGKFIAALQNPSVVGHTVVESLPLMLGGGVVGRGVMAAAPRVSAGVAAAAGEGVIGAGSAAEQIRQETPDGLLTPTQSGLAALSGVGTAAFGALGNKVAKSLGIHDVDTMLVGAKQNPAMADGVVRRVLKGAVAEGVLEELPQSIQEQVLQNAALGRPLEQGVDQAAVLGLLSGAAMGGGANVLGGGHRSVAANDPSDTAVPPANDPLALPAPRITVGSDGIARTADQRQQTRESTAAAVGGIVERGPLSRAANAIDAQVSDVEVKPASPMVDEGAAVLPAPAAEAGPVPPSGVEVSVSEPPVTVAEPSIEVGAAPEIDLGQAGEAEGRPTISSTAKAERGESARMPTAAVFPTYDAANDFRREQKLRGATIDALPAPVNGGFVLARKGTAEYAAGEALREERHVARERAAAGVLDGDILNKLGKPFTVRHPAINAAKNAGEGHEVVAVKGGFVVRKEAAKVGATSKIFEAAAAASAPATAAAALTVRDAQGMTYPTKGEALPEAGVVPANLGSNGTVYIGRRNGQHFEIANEFSHSERGDFKSTGFVNADGQYMDREQALAWVEKNEKAVKPSGNMEGALDALDYREQVSEAQRSGKGGNKATKSKRGLKSGRQALEREEARASHFKPGNVVPSYGGKFDRVVSYQKPDSEGRWSVTVHEARKTGDSTFEDVPGAGARTHSTQPDTRELKGGPVGSMAAQEGSKRPSTGKRADQGDAPDSTSAGSAEEVRSPVESKERGGTANGTRDGAETPMFSRTQSSSHETARREVTSDVQKARLLQGEPVAVLAGDQAPHGYALLRTWATKLFSAVGGKARNAEIGDVMLDERSVRDSMAHRMNPFKAEAFAAVPQVIEKGVVISSATHENQDSFYISAPVRIRGVDDLVTVLVRRNPETQRMYLHSVATKEYLLTRFKSRTDAEASEHTGGAESGDTGSIVSSEARFGKLQGDEVARELNRLLTLKLDQDGQRDGAGTHAPAFSRSAGYGDAVDAAIQSGIKGEPPGRQPVAVGSIAPALRAAGIPDGALRISPTILSKAVFDHGVTKSVLKRLPEMLQSPVMVFESDTVLGSFVVVTSEMVNEKPLLVVVSPQESTGAKTFSFVPSLYPKEDISAIQRWLASGKLRYLDTEQSPQWFGSTRLQLPGEFRTAKGLQRVNVATQSAAVKPAAGGGGAPAFSRSAQTRGAFEARIDALYAGEKPKPQGVRILDRSDVLALLGLGDGPVHLVESKVEQGRFNHGLTAADWKKVPEWLENPAAVFDSETSPGRLVFIGPEPVRGVPLRMIIDPRPSGNGVNLLINAYEAERNPFDRWERDGLLRYVDRQKTTPATGSFQSRLTGLPGEQGKTAMVWKRAGGQFPGQAANQGRGRILTEKQLGGYRRANNAAFSIGHDSGMSVEAAQRVVDSIKGKWKNAPRVTVVPALQHADVPEEVRKANAAQRSQGASGEPEGFFFRGEVFIVAGQLATEQDVARVLFHESLGHFGLRGAFGADLLPILQQLVGVRRAEVAAKAREYGLDMSNPQDRLMAAEELLAELAQTVPELGFVQRAIAAIRSWLRRNLSAYKNLKLSDAEILRDFILPARGWVERGVRDGSPLGRVRFSRDAEKASDFAQEVDKAAAAGVADDPQVLREPVSLGIDTPQALQLLGIARKPVFTTRNLIAKMHLDHGVPRSALKTLPELLANPVLVFGSDTQPGRLVVVTALVVQGNPVVVAVDPNGKSGRADVVFLPSAYPKDNADRQFSAWTRSGLLQYANKEKSRQLATTAGLQLPGVVQRAIGFRANYKTEADLPSVAGTNAPAFSRGESTLRELSKADDLFALPKSNATTVEGIARDNDTDIAVKKSTPFAGRVDYQLTMPDGGFARLFVREPNPYGPSVYDSTRVDGEDQASATERPGVNPEDVPPTGDVWIDVSQLRPGGDTQFGAKVYNIAATYAHNTDRIFIGDPNGLNRTALRRRLEHMISSALKFGTTAHLAPHPDQVAGGNGVPALKWVYGDHVGNVERMIAASIEAMDNAFPKSKFIEYDPDSGSFRRQGNGARLRRGQLAVGLRESLREGRSVVQSGAAESEAGWRTVARAAVFRALARREGAGGAGANGRSNGLLEQLLQHAAGVGDAQVDRRIFYSRSAARPGSGTAAAPGGASEIQRGDARADEATGIGDRPNATSDLNDPRAFRAKASQAISDLFEAPGSVGWWHKTVGTMHNLAKRSPQFGRVFDAVQTFLSDVSAHASEAADLAPTLLPKLETWRDIGKSPISAEDTKAIAAPIFEGTLSWARDADGKLIKMADLEARHAALNNEDKTPMPQAGVVFTDAELKATFRSTPEQIRLYREFRAAVDQSLNRVTISEMLRFGGKDVEAMRGIAMDAGSADAAGLLLRDHLLAMAEETPARADVLTDTANKMIEKADRAKSLIDRGYAPLSRFGNHTVDVLDEAGERAYFGMFESRAEASRMARRMRENYPRGTITRGTVSQQAYKLFSGITPETLELFGEMVGLESQGEDAQHQMFQEYLKLAKANRSAMKRLIERKGVAGFNEDAGRVLAGFVYSNARLTSTNMHTGEINQAVADIPKAEGELKDMAVKLADYVRNPQEEAQALRGMLFAQYLGGSLASAMVNMTQPIAVTMPYLSQWGGALKAAGRMRGALADVLKKSTGDARLDAALKKAEEEGVVAPQEVHQLMAQAQGRSSLRAGDGTLAGKIGASASNFISKASLAWGKPFAAAEQFNRRVTFIAAYRTAVAEGVASPARFAEEAIRETQFVYNKGNKPQWARGAIGGTLFTFKQYSISYMELLHRMATTGGAEGKKAALFSLAMLFLMGGAGGLPFMGDAEDALDGIMQRLGYSFSSKQARRQFFIDVLGADAAKFVERGISGLPGVPIDVAGRLGMGNLIPGTGLLTKKQDYGRDVAEILGPAGDFAQRAFQGAGEALSGKPIDALTTASPTAARNVAKAFDMYQTGMYRDQKGRKVIDADGYDALVKAIGFQPSGVAQVQDASAAQQNLIGQNKLMRTELADSMANAVFERDLEKQQDVRNRMLAWNRANPQSPVTIDMAGVRRRVVAMRQSKSERVEKTAPKAIRGEVRAALQEGAV